MLFGNRHDIAIEIRPLSPKWERRYPPERTAWATLLIWIAGENLCLHRPSGASSIEDGPNVPLGPICDWLVRSWSHLCYEERARLFATSDQLHDDLDRWGDLVSPANVTDDEWVDAREAWWGAHFLQAGADGAYLPYVAFARQEDRLIVDWKTPLGRPGEIEFLNSSGRASVSWAAAVACISQFASFVSKWFADEALESVYPWIGTVDPLATASVGASENLALFTRRTESDLRRLTSASSTQDVRAALDLPEASVDPAESPVTQVLRDLPPDLPDSVGELIALLLKAIRQTPPALGQLRSACATARLAAASDEEAGYLAAAAARHEVGLNGKPIDDVAEVMRFLGVMTLDSNLAVTKTEMIAGRRSSQGSAAILLHSERMKVEWARRFELARALGHLLVDEERGQAVGCASGAFGTGVRRRRSGAFAAEFLLPRSALVELTEDTLDRAAEPNVFKEIMSRYRVGATTAAYHLWNRGFLSTMELRDELIETYASTS